MYYIHSESNSVLGYFTTGLENILHFGKLNPRLKTELGVLLAYENNLINPNPIIINVDMINELTRRFDTMLD